MRRQTREIRIGNKKIGKNNPILIQSMTNTKTSDIKETITQIHELTEAGCEIIRVAVPDMKSAYALKEIKRKISIPLVADIHFDYRLAIESAKHADKIRINPGNIGSKEHVKAIINTCKQKNIPIRVGINSGSINKRILKKFKKTPQGLFESAKEYVKMFEEFRFDQVVFSLKSSDVIETVKANRLFSKKYDYPLHLGITEAGTKEIGNVKSYAGIGSLLIDGIGDTIRISLTDDPIEEIYAQIKLLQGLRLRKGKNIISCPTCARTTVDLIKITKEIKDNEKDITIAIMGCEVNGPKEAQYADLGIACSKEKGYIFKKGKIIKTVSEEKIVDTFVAEYNRF